MDANYLWKILSVLQVLQDICNQTFHSILPARYTLKAIAFFLVNTNTLSTKPENVSAEQKACYFLHLTLDFIMKDPSVYIYTFVHLFLLVRRHYSSKK